MEEIKMRFLQRVDLQQHNHAGGDGDPGAGNQLQQAREQGDRLLAAGDEAIRRALSGNSESFLRAGRQQGGQ
jgi:hypothetical protein